MQSSNARFLGRLKNMQNGCIEWQGPRDKNGYGRLSYNGRPMLAHRVAWHIANNSVSNTDLMICHHCDNPPCCNPAHLFVGTAADNVKDMWRKGREAALKPRVGSDVNTSKLTATDVRAILASKLPSNELATKFGVTKEQINNIRSRRQWRHIHV